MRISDWSSDVCSSDLYVCIAICAALHRRNLTDCGDIIDVAMLGCQLAMLSYQGTYSLVAGVDPGPQGAMHDSIPTYRSFKARDGRELVVTANTEKMRSEEHTSELQSLMRISYAVFCLKKTNK